MRGGDLRQPLALLLLRAEQQQRLRQPDRLVRRQQRRNAGVARPGQHHRAVVVDLRETETAVLLGHLHAQGADVLAVRRRPRRRSCLRARSPADRPRPPGTCGGPPGTVRPSRRRRPAVPAAGRSARAGSRRGRAPCRSSAASSPSRGRPPRSLALLCSRYQWPCVTSPRHRCCGWKPGIVTWPQTAHHAAPAPTSARIPTPVWRTTVPRPAARRGGRRAFCSPRRLTPCWSCR